MGFDLSKGGAITYLSKPNSTVNIVNNADLGRQIQYAYYAYPQPFQPAGVQLHPSWQNIGWDPIQTGDVYNNPSEVTCWNQQGNKLIFRTYPKQWALNNYSGDCYVDTEAELLGMGVKVTHTLHNQRTDSYYNVGKGQNIFGSSINAPFWKIVTYDGDSPFTNAPLTVTTAPVANKDTSLFATERWAALVNDDGLAFGAWVPDHFIYKSNCYGDITNKTGGEYDFTMRGLMGERVEMLDRDIVFSSSHVIMLGTVDEIRNYVYQNLQNQAESSLPDFNFQSNRQHWYFMETTTTDDGWQSINSSWTVKPSRYFALYSPEVLFKASGVPKLYLRMAVNIPQIQFIRLQWARLDGGSGQKFIYFNNDGQMHDYEIDMSQEADWTGSITNLRIAAPDNSVSYSPNSWFKLSRLSHLASSTSGSSCNISLSGVGGSVNCGATVQASSLVSCAGADCGSVTYKVNGSTSFQAPTAPGNYTYTVTMEKPGCSGQSVQVNVTTNCQAPPVTGVCDFASPLTVGNWNGVPVQIRKYPNGKVVLVTLEQGSSTDRHFPRGDNFWDIDGFVKTLPNAEQYRSCLNGGQTDWYGLVFPSGMTPPSGYVQGNMADGAVYFEQSGGGTNPCNYTLAANNSTVSCGAQVGVSNLVSCTGGDCSGLSYSYNGSSTITASSSPGSTAYLISVSKAGCSGQSISVSLTTNCSSGGGSTSYSCQGYSFTEGQVIGTAGPGNATLRQENGCWWVKWEGGSASGPTNIDWLPLLANKVAPDAILSSCLNWDREGSNPCNSGARAIAASDPIQSGSGLLISPNPASGRVRVQAVSGEPLRKVLCLTTSGKVLYESRSGELNVSGLADGVYLIEAWSQRGQRLRGRLIRGQQAN